ncbi:MAG: DUF427 domain-containing protein [Bacteroidia bacterium]|nr:DUF427 domain-containing protein [Bacteroidia bacterium]
MAKSIKRIPPGPGQESVWDYPRPPRLEPVSTHLRVIHQGEIIADTNRAYRVLETSHPPVYYISSEDMKKEFIHLHPGASSFCEFKGRAVYHNLEIGNTRILKFAWSYPNPSQEFAAIKDYLAIYASKVDECWVGDEKVQAQEGDFYGGWITSKVVGPFKGGAGTWGW